MALESPNVLEKRIRMIRFHPKVNGIDHLELGLDPTDSNRAILSVFFIDKTTEEGASGRSSLLDTLASNKDYFSIVGGSRIKNVKVIDVRHIDDALELSLKPVGDYSIYRLKITHETFPDGLRLDTIFSKANFTFKNDLLERFDCKSRKSSSKDLVSEPIIDYTAKDYAGFRRALLDLIPSRLPGWKDLHEADINMVLIELFSYVADQLSYYQDAVANEAYLETARHRISVRRHARLIDYSMHDGASARTFIHVSVSRQIELVEGTNVINRIEKPLKGKRPPHGPVLDYDVLNDASIVFQTMESVTLYPELNEISIHTWGQDDFCLPPGTTDLYLRGDLSNRLKSGDLLLLEEIGDPSTYDLEAANPSHRQVVRITSVETDDDPLDISGLLTLTRVSWDEADSLSFPLWVCSKPDGESDTITLAVVRGNLVLADHGKEVNEWFPKTPSSDISSVSGTASNSSSGTDPSRTNPSNVDEAGTTGASFSASFDESSVSSDLDELSVTVPAEETRPFRFTLKNGPLSQRIPISCTKSVSYKTASSKLSNNIDALPVSDLFDIELSCAVPEVKELKLVTSYSSEDWTLVSPTLLYSGPLDRNYVVETDDDGRATVRFGDGHYGMALPDDPCLCVRYRIGCGSSGNVSSDSLRHLIFPKGSDLADLKNPGILDVRNPLSAFGGTDPEQIDEVKLNAPAAIQASQCRAVLEEDYAKAAMQHPKVSSAVAVIRWTGSWPTVFVYIDQIGNDELEGLEDEVKSIVSGYTLAGYDICVTSPIYVSLEIVIEVYVSSYHYKEHVEEALRDVLRSGTTSFGKKGFFHPDNFTFATPLYISQLYAVVEAVEGVVSSNVIVFRRSAWGKIDDLKEVELKAGKISTGRFEILRLKNDPNYPENGTLELRMYNGS